MTELDPNAVLAVLKARASQTYADLLDEVARLTVYCNQLTAENDQLRAQAAQREQENR